MNNRLPRKPGKRMTAPGTMRLACPHCGHVASARTSRAITPLYKEMRFQCTNVGGDRPCAHTFVASLIIERTIVQSARPNPDISLPVA